MINRRELLTGGAYALTAAAFGLAVGPTLYRKFLEYKNEDELKLEISKLRTKILNEYGVEVDVDKTQTGVIDRKGNRTLTSKPMYSLYFQLLVLQETAKQIQIYPPDTLSRVLDKVIISDAFIYQHDGIQPSETTMINSVSSDGRTLFYISTRGRALMDDYRIVMFGKELMEEKFLPHELTHGVEVYNEKEVQEKFLEISKVASQRPDGKKYAYNTFRDYQKDLEESAPRPTGFASHYGKSFYSEDFATIGELIFGKIKYTPDMDKDEVLQMKIKYVKEVYEKTLNLPSTYWDDLKKGIVNEEYWKSLGRTRSG